MNIIEKIINFFEISTFSPAKANADPGDVFYINSISIDDTKGYPSKAGDDANLIIELCNISDEIIVFITPFVIPSTTPLVFPQIPDISGTSGPNSEITEKITAIYTVTQEDVDRGFFEFEISSAKYRFGCSYSGMKKESRLISSLFLLSYKLSL